MTAYHTSDKRRTYGSALGAPGGFRRTEIYSCEENLLAKARLVAMQPELVSRRLRLTARVAVWSRSRGASLPWPSSDETWRWRAKAREPTRGSVIKRS